MPQRALDKQTLQALEQWRKERHQAPETAGNEADTADAFAAWVRDCGATSVLTGLGGHGVLACFDSGQAGPNWLFRAELDALPIPEGPDAKERPHRSQREGAAHLCGHDGHLSILAGLGRLLQNTPPAKGRVFLLAQPAEETGQGARAVMTDPQWPFQATRTTAVAAAAGLKAPDGEQGDHASKSDAPFGTLDACIAIHNLPELPLGHVWCREDSATAAVCSLAMHWKGYTAHAAEPENGRNPAFAVQAALQEAACMEQRDPEQSDFLLAVPVQAKLAVDPERFAEPAYGTAAGSAALHLTFRAWTQKRLEAAMDAFEAEAEEQAEQHELALDMQRVEAFAACRNAPALVRRVTEAAIALDMSLLDARRPFRWGEDFGLFTQAQDGVLIGLGAGETCPPLHHPEYDFPDALMPVALALYAKLLEQAGL